MSHLLIENEIKQFKASLFKYNKNKPYYKLGKYKDGIFTYDKDINLTIRDFAKKYHLPPCKYFEKHVHTRREETVPILVSALCRAFAITRLDSTWIMIKMPNPFVIKNFDAFISNFRIITNIENALINQLKICDAKDKSEIKQKLKVVASK